MANSSYTDNIPTIANNIVLNKDHHDINYKTITSTLTSHETGNNNKENTDNLVFPFVSAVAIKPSSNTHNNNEDTFNYHPCVNDPNNVNHFYDRQE